MSEDLLIRNLDRDQIEVDMYSKGRGISKCRYRFSHSSMDKASKCVFT